MKATFPGLSAPFFVSGILELDLSHWQPGNLFMRKAWWQKEVILSFSFTMFEGNSPATFLYEMALDRTTHRMQLDGEEISDGRVRALVEGIGLQVLAAAEGHAATRLRELIEFFDANGTLYYDNC